jgi:hypothetical protein
MQLSLRTNEFAPYFAQGNLLRQSSVGFSILNCVARALGLFGTTIDPGPSGEAPDILSGNLAMSDRRVLAPVRSDRSLSRGLGSYRPPRHDWPAFSAQHDANREEQLCRTGIP